MQAKKRYALLLLFLLLLVFLQKLLFPGAPDPGGDGGTGNERRGEKLLLSLAQPYLDPLRDLVHDSDILGRRPSLNPLPKGATPRQSILPTCSMGSCFNFTRCQGPSLKVHMYPKAPLEANSADPNLPHLSLAYSKILTALKRSGYYTDSPADACLFILTFDTLDRDPLSGNYVKNLPSKLRSLDPEIWDEGRNHILFNLYSGTWPDYNPVDLQLHTGIGFAMLAKASSSQEFFRPNFDISLPLFHPDMPLHDSSGDDSHALQTRGLTNDQYLLVFKGKRYVHGIGSEARNSLYHLHNDKDIVLVTTCQHGKSWKSLQDERCASDNANYLKWDYEKLMGEATFCLVPRGRRLGSFRFLETLQSGCIPVILSNGWVLPFAEIIDWSRAVLWADERLIFQIPEMLRSIPTHKILEMKRQCQKIFRLYFSSVQRILFTSLQIVEGRVRRWKSRGVEEWNEGSVLLQGGVDDTPFPPLQLPLPPSFTAVIYSTPSPHTSTNSLLHLISILARSSFCKEIRILWDSPHAPPKLPTIKDLTIRLRNVQGQVTDFDYYAVTDAKLAEAGYPLTVQGSRCKYTERVSTSAVFMIDERANITTDEVDFAMEVWRWFPDSLVGFFGRSHLWDRKMKGWTYTSKLLPHYSSILTHAAVLHRYFLESMNSHAIPPIRRVLEEAPECEDLFLNFMMSEMTGKAPIKVGNRIGGPESSPHQFRTRQLCFQTFSSAMGHLPLRRTLAQIDPLLFRDPVAIAKKLYRQMET